MFSDLRAVSPIFVLMENGFHQTFQPSEVSPKRQVVNDIMEENGFKMIHLFTFILIYFLILSLIQSVFAACLTLLCTGVKADDFDIVPTI